MSKSSQLWCKSGLQSVVCALSLSWSCAVAAQAPSPSPGAEPLAGEPPAADAPLPPGATPVVGAPPPPAAGQGPAVEADVPPKDLPPTEASAGISSAQEAAASEAPSEAGSWSDAIVLSGYVEAYYSHNFAKPENGITNNRWLDERHNTFTLQTLALDIAAAKGPLSAKVTLMFGPTADRWYFEGARIPDSETNTYLSPGVYSNETWKHIQTAYAGYEAPIGKGLLLQGGLMPTQVGYESAPAKDNWNFSRSNLFNFLPFFHVGARVSYPLADWLTVTGAVYNGWNQASDLNKQKTLSLQFALLRDKWLFNLLYLGGVERPKGDVGGQPWRNLFDAVVQYDVLPMLSLAASADCGFEQTDLGTDSWYAGALHARLKANSWLYFAARGDGIYEHVATRGGDSAAIFFGGGNHVASGTFTIEARPVDGFSFRVEYRHDDSDKDVPLFYKKGFNPDMTQRTSSVQNTLTLGMTGWF